MSANKTLLLLLSAFAVLSFSGALYMYNEYRVLDQNYQAIQENIDNVSINIDFIVDFGNGTIIYFNQTRVPVGFTMYDSTEFIIGEENVDSTYYSDFNAYFVNSLLGTGNNPEYAWSAWHYQQDWELLEIGSNLFIPKDGQTIAWYYQDVNEFGLGNPN
ncbi:MAG: hypothetical protein CMO19_03010 [Thaumarchaeota archaeon]|nr:hypothetical protein [Nitrososphaerota archaeon]|tara:strand:+ start:5871 stop:6347 length:477 start_codon:yes stop_codon:yes gene_type:complete